jgi:uncharacterized membrane protein YhaH (DUF805 family)
MFYMKKSSRYWLWGTICLIVINLIVYLFRNYVDEILLLWAVILTPVACLALYPITCLLDRKELSRNENKL